MSNLSLINIMRDDQDFGRRIAKKTQEIKEDKQHLNAIASEYSSKYEREIAEGEKLKRNLLTEGERAGRTREESLSGHGFIPQRCTPILNMLYFLLRESEDDECYGKRHYERRDHMNETLVKNGRAAIEETYESANFSNLSEEEAARILDEFIDGQFSKPSSHERKAINAQFDNERRSSEEAFTLKEPNSMVEYLYGSLTLDQFDILKKLKALAMSNINQHESFLAWKKGQELCRKYQLDWDRIPCSIKNKS
jgi:hypothetical protein